MKTSASRLFPPQHTTLDKGHGRIEERRVWTSGELRGFSSFPHLSQVVVIKRIYSKLDGTQQLSDVCYAVTSLSEQQANPARLLEPGRGHWTIENKVHYVRDRTFDEDRSQVRKKAAPHAMASLRNLAISLLRLAGVSNATSIAAALRHCGRNIRATLRLIGLP